MVENAPCVEYHLGWTLRRDANLEPLSKKKHHQRTAWLPCAHLNTLRSTEDLYAHINWISPSKTSVLRLSVFIRFLCETGGLRFFEGLYYFYYALLILLVSLPMCRGSPSGPYLLGIKPLDPLSFGGLC